MLFNDVPNIKEICRQFSLEANRQRQKQINGLKQEIKKNAAENPFDEK